MDVANAMQAPLFPQTVPGNGQAKKTGDKVKGGSLFQSLLLNESLPDETPLEQEAGDETESTGDADALNSLADFVHRLFEMSDTGDENESLDSLIHDVPFDEILDWDGDESEAVMHYLLEGSTELDASLEEELMSSFNSGERPNENALNAMLQSFMQSDEGKAMESFQQMLEKAEGILKTMQTSGDTEKQSHQLLKLMEQWSALSEKNGSSTASVMKAVLANNEHSAEHSTWKELLANYQKRTTFERNKLFESNTKVTNKDVSKWLKQLIPKDAKHTEGKALMHHGGNSHTAPMSQIEQYMIHLEQEGTEPESPSRQLLDQFQKIMQSSKFSAGPNGTNQLSISLKPEHLGDMTVKLTQLDGELTAKIMVTSQAAKEMLEANLHQLKNMFSPHQVVIERTEVTDSFQEVFNEEGDDSSTEEEKHGKNSDESSPDEQQEPTSEQENEFEAYMDELLFHGQESAGELSGGY